jgi:membrane protease YdiL (CAAX protease family)
MKKCSWCGKEYEDDAAVCALDGEPLIGEEHHSQPQPQAFPAAIATPPDASAPPVIRKFEKQAVALPARTFNDLQFRVFELILVCAVAFAPSILGSFYHLAIGTLSRSGQGPIVWANMILHETTALALLCYMLARRSKSVLDLGLRPRWRDVGWSVLLIVIGSMAYGFVYWILYCAGLTHTAEATANQRVARYLFPSRVSVIALLAQFVNPFFEETIVRGYVITEVRELTGSAWKGVVASALLQTSYHFYQGGSMALSEGASFLVFSIFYAKTRRLTPLVAAHLYMDVGATLAFWLSHH